MSLTSLSRLGPQCREQRLGGLLQKLILGVAADLQQCDVGETGFPVRPDGVDDRVEIRTTGNAVGDIFRPDELCRAGKSGGSGQVGVDFPAAAEPAELV